MEILERKDEWFYNYEYNLNCKYVRKHCKYRPDFVYLDQKRMNCI